MDSREGAESCGGSPYIPVLRLEFLPLNIKPPASTRKLRPSGNRGSSPDFFTFPASIIYILHKENDYAGNAP